MSESHGESFAAPTQGGVHRRGPGTGSGRARACLGDFTARAQELLEVLEGLVAIDSPSHDTDGIQRFVGEYGALLEQAGVTVREIPGPGGPHLFGELQGPSGGGPPIVLVGHSDTVWPRGEASRRPPRREGGKLYGPGVCDMRAGLVIGAFALRALQESGVELRRPVQIFVSADEELGSRDAHPHMERLLPRGATALVLEPPLEDGSVKIARKGVGMYTVRTRGVEAHAGLEPERGASAITELAHQVLQLLSWADPASGLTLNIGQIRGGIATNVIAGHAEAGLDVRFDSLPVGEEVHARLQRLVPRDPRTRVSVEGGIIFPPLIPGPGTHHLADLATGIARDLGLEIARGKAGGGSDGSFLASRGLTVLDGLGVDGGGAHAIDEHIRMDRLPVRAALLTLLLEQLCNAGASAPGP